MHIYEQMFKHIYVRVPMYVIRVKVQCNKNLYTNSTIIRLFYNYLSIIVLATVLQLMYYTNLTACR